MRDFSFTSLSVTDGHPDKLCDRISDAIVDAYLRLDPACRIDAECAVTTGILFSACHTSSAVKVDVADVARRVVAETGHELLADGHQAPVVASIARLPPLPEDGPARPAGQNVMTFGYATRQTEVLMPLPIVLAHALVRRLGDFRGEAAGAFLGPDGQAQVTVRYRDRMPVAIEGITLLVQLDADGAPEQAELGALLRRAVVEPACAGGIVSLDERTRVHVNPPSVILPAGPSRHAGVTGRKIGVDLYGDYCRQTSAALSGKDPSRIDRIGSYAARHAAKNVVAAGLAKECEVQLAYTIGREEPLSLEVDSFGSGALPDEEIGARVRRVLDFRPAGIEARFELRRRAAESETGFFQPLAVFGQVGREDLRVPWESLDSVDALA